MNRLPPMIDRDGIFTQARLTLGKRHEKSRVLFLTGSSPCDAIGVRQLRVRRISNGKGGTVTTAIVLGSSSINGEPVPRHLAVDTVGLLKRLLQRGCACWYQ